MTDFIYEKDLTNMKFNILSSPFHNRMIKELSEKYNVRSPRLRKVLMENFDMSLLENLPARYYTWKSETDEDSMDYILGATLFTQYLPLLGEDEVKAVLVKTENEIEAGTDRNAAMSMAKEIISEMICR